MGWVLKTFRGLTDDASVTNLNQLRINLNDFLRLHVHDGTPGQGAALLLGLNYQQIPCIFPDANSGWFTRVAGGGTHSFGYLGTDNTLIGHTVTFFTALRAGTWRLDLLHRKANNFGVATVALDGAFLGTIDFYNSSSQNNQESSLTSLTVTSLSVNSLQSLMFSMLTKNASSSAYGAAIQFIALRRTGD